MTQPTPEPDWFHKMSAEDRLATVRSGYKPNGPAKAGPGVLREIETVDRKTGRMTTSWEGDPEVWMSAFKPAQRMRVLAFRGNATDEQWAQTKAQNEAKMAALRK